MSIPVQISVITPTFNRERHLQNLISCFQWQTQTGLELLILDDSTQPSQLLQSGSIRDPRIRYMHSTQRLTIGEKRNRLIEESRGTIIVQFDDDDYYAPRYIERMIQHLGENDLVKLGAWFGFSGAKDQFFYWDTTCTSSVHFVVGPSDPLIAVSMEGSTEEFFDKNLWGYGFSYVVKKHVFERVRFEDRNWGEDYSLIELMRKRGYRMSHASDGEGLALHVIHLSNTSRTFPQYLIPSALADHLFGLKVRPFLSFSDRP